MILQQTEVAVVGGGMVGSALALGLAQQGLTITVVERVLPKTFDASSQPSIRVSALSIASINLLQRLGVWDNICKMRAHPYRRLETWEWDNARVTFDANELNLPQLGYIVENNVLQQALWQELRSHPNITLCAPTSLTALRRNNQGYYLTLNGSNEILATLVIGADGVNSQARQMANIDIHIWKYHQSCLLIIVQCENDPGVSAWQHFTPNGPHAFLPLFEHWASLVWYDTSSRIHQLQKLSMLQLEREIVCQFPSRLGKVRPIESGIFPLTRLHALQYVREGFVLIGDAAHAIHPLAGQGVNLGYRDVDALLNIISFARSHGELWSSQTVLTRYQRQRMMDNFVMQSWMDLLYIGFSNNVRPLRFLRNIGLMMTERSGGLKRQILKYALGL